MNATIHNNEATSRFRSGTSIAEICLWSFLKDGQLMGFTFERQGVADRFVADFYCSKLKLAIELGAHPYLQEKVSRIEAAREKRLKKAGIKVLRFDYTEIMQDIDAVLNRIEKAVKKLGMVQSSLVFS